MVFTGRFFIHICGSQIQANLVLTPNETWVLEASTSTGPMDSMYLRTALNNLYDFGCPSNSPSIVHAPSALALGVIPFLPSSPFSPSSSTLPRLRAFSPRRRCCKPQYTASLPAAGRRYISRPVLSCGYLAAFQGWWSHRHRGSCPGTGGDKNTIVGSCCRNKN